MAATNPGVPWSDADSALVRQHFPSLGARGMHAAGLLTNRTQKAITNRASDLKVAAVSEAEWGVPQHLYSAEDLALRAWGGPVERAPLRWVA